MRSPRHVRRAVLLVLNLLLVLAMVYTGSRIDIVDKRGLLLADVAKADTIIPDASIGYNFRLTSMRATDQHQTTIFDTATGQVSTHAVLDRIHNGTVSVGPTTVQGTARAGIYLVKDQLTTLTGANVRLQVPLLNFDGPLTETSPGIYTTNLSDTITFTGTPYFAINCSGTGTKPLGISSVALAE